MWKTKNHKNEEVKWYSEDEYKRLLMKIVELKKQLNKTGSEKIELISKLDRQRETIAKIMSVTDEEQKIIDAIKEEIENDINSNFIKMKSNYFKTILKKKNIIRKENYIYKIWERPILIDDTIENDFILTK